MKGYLRVSAVALAAEMSADWRDQASCRDHDPDLWFLPGRPDTVAARRQIAEAKAICRRCPVRQPCAEWAVYALPHGIAGGLTEDERQTLRRRDAAQPQPASPKPGDDVDPDSTEGVVRQLLREGWTIRDVHQAMGVPRRQVEAWSKRARESVNAP